MGQGRLIVPDLRLLAIARKSRIDTIRQNKHIGFHYTARHQLQLKCILLIDLGVDDSVNSHPHGKMCESYQCRKASPSNSHFHDISNSLQENHIQPTKFECVLTYESEPESRSDVSLEFQGQKTDRG
jgi:hypothetical protein